MKGLITSIVVTLLGTTIISGSVMGLLNKPVTTEAEYIMVGVLLILGMPSLMILSFLIYLWVEKL